MEASVGAIVASASSYILFSQTSRPFGTRDLWGPLGLPGDTAGAVPGLINGAIADFPLSAFNAFQGTEFVRSDWALFDFDHTGEASPGAVLTGAIDGAAVTADGRVFATPAGPRNPDAAIALDPEAIRVQLADADWNGIKNVEVLTDGGGVFLRNVVDVRVKLAHSLVPEGEQPPQASIVIENVKRGEIDGSGLGHLIATLSFASNGPGWGNTFVIKGGPGPSDIRLLPGDWAGGTTALDGFQNLVNDGSLTRVVVTMSADSSLDARAVAAMTDVRAGTDAGRFYAPWEGFGVETSDAGDALAISFEKPAALIEIGLYFALPGPLPTLGPATLWRNGAAVETIDPSAIELVAVLDTATGEQALIVGVDWLASRSVDTLTIEGLGGLGEPVWDQARGARPGATGVAETPPDEVRGTDGSGSLLVGGPGVNVFRYATGDGVDTIWNFTRGQDVLVLEANDARVYETVDGTVVLFGPLDRQCDYCDVIDESNGITLVGAHDLVIGTDIIFA